MPQEVSDQSSAENGLEVRISKLEGSPVSERGKFVQAFEFIPHEGSGISPDRGKLFAVLDLMIGSSADPAIGGKLVWDTLAEEYYAPEEETPIQALERAVYAVREKLRSLSPTATLDLGAVAIREGVTYFARLGHPALYFRRGLEASNLLMGEEVVSIGSQILEEGDVLVLGSPIFAKNFPSESLPRTEFLEKQFAESGGIPGFAAFLLRVGSSREAREAAVRRSQSSRLVLRRLWQRLNLFFGWVVGFVRQIPGVLRKPSELGKRVVAAWGKHISHGRELAAKKKVAVVSGAEAVAEPKVSAPPMKIKWPKIRGITLGRVIAVLAVVLTASIAFTIWRQAQNNKVAEFERLLSVSTQDLDQAGGLVGLSNERAKELIDEARGDLTLARGLSSDTSRIDALLSRADSIYNAIEKITAVSENNLVYDLTLQAQGASGLSLSGAGGTVYALEETRDAVFALTFSGKLPKATALGEGKILGAREVVAEGNYLYLLSSDKVYRLNVSTKKVDEPISFDRITKVIDLDTYLGNIYLLVPKEEQVYKFWNLAGGYSRAVTWVKESVSMTGVVDLTIDGDLWLLETDGTITHLSRGKQVSFAISNLSTPLQDPSKIFTRPQLKDIYILDKANQRVVVLDKTGNFVRQFKGSALSDGKDLWVSANEKTLFVLSGSKVYRISL